MPTTKQSGGWLAGIFAAIIAALGIHHVVTTPTTPSNPPADTAQHAPPVTTPPVTTPVDTPSTPVVTPPSTDTVHGPSLFFDDFTAYNSTADFLARVSSNFGGTAKSGALYTDGANYNLVSLDKTVLFHGHPTLKYSQPGGVPNTPELWTAIPPSSHVCIQAFIRFAPGWTTVGTGKTISGVDASGKPIYATSSAAYKLLGYNFGDGYDGSGRIEITNTTQYQDYFGVVSRTKGTVAPNVFAVAGNIATEWTDGQFYQYVIDVDVSKGQTGTAKFYIGKDGTTPAYRTTSTTKTSESAWPRINQINWGMNYNQVRNPGQALSLNYGSMRAVDCSQGNPFPVTQ